MGNTFAKMKLFGAVTIFLSFKEIQTNAKQIKVPLAINELPATYTRDRKAVQTIRRRQLDESGFGDIVTANLRATTEAKDTPTARFATLGKVAQTTDDNQETDEEKDLSIAAIEEAIEEGNLDEIKKQLINGEYNQGIKIRVNRGGMDAPIQTFRPLDDDVAKQQKFNEILQKAYSSNSEKEFKNSMIEKCLLLKDEIQNYKEVEKAQWCVEHVSLPNEVADIDTITQILNFELESKYDNVFKIISSVYKISEDEKKLWKKFGKIISKDALYGATLNDGTEEDKSILYRLININVKHMLKGNQCNNIGYYMVHIFFDNLKKLPYDMRLRRIEYYCSYTDAEKTEMFEAIKKKGLPLRSSTVEGVFNNFNSFISEVFLEDDLELGYLAFFLEVLYLTSLNLKD
eukprot:g2562.t1